VLPKDLTDLASAYSQAESGQATTWKSVEVRYNESCAGLVNKVTVEQALTEIDSSRRYTLAGCTVGSEVRCELGDDSGKECRMNVRSKSAS
jgi:hypothetical protein